MSEAFSERVIAADGIGPADRILEKMLVLVSQVVLVELVGIDVLRARI